MLRVLVSTSNPILERQALGSTIRIVGVMLCKQGCGTARYRQAISLLLAFRRDSLRFAAIGGRLKGTSTSVLNIKRQEGRGNAAGACSC